MHTKNQNKLTRKIDNKLLQTNTLPIELHHYDGRTRTDNFRFLTKYLLSTLRQIVCLIYIWCWLVPSLARIRGYYLVSTLVLQFHVLVESIVAVDSRALVINYGE